MINPMTKISEKLHLPSTDLHVSIIRELRTAVVDRQMVEELRLQKLRLRTGLEIPRLRGLSEAPLRRLGGLPLAPLLPGRASPGWILCKGHGKTKHKDRDVSPTMGGTLDTSDDDATVDRSKGPAKGTAKSRGKGGWTPAIDRHAGEMLASGCPLVHLPLGARPGENLRRGDISVRHNDTVREVLPQGDEEALEHASRMQLVRIPDTGFIRYRYGIQGRGRWDGRSDIFRCIVICENCDASECNKRMWYQLITTPFTYVRGVCETTKLGLCSTRDGTGQRLHAMLQAISYTDSSFRVDG